MIRSRNFLISKNPYAVKLSSATFGEYVRGRDDWSRVVCMEAAWYRRRNGVLHASLGVLTGIQKRSTPWSVTPLPEARNRAEILSRMPYVQVEVFASCDGSSYWGVKGSETMHKDLKTLRPMLENFPNVPKGYSGWWFSPSSLDKI